MLCSGVGPGAGLGGSRSPSSPCPTSFDSQMETESGVKLKTTRTHAHTTRGRGWKSPGVPEEIGSTKAKKSRGAERWNQRGVVAALVPVVPAALGVPSPPRGHRGGATAPLCPGWAVLCWPWQGLVGRACPAVFAPDPRPPSPPAVLSLRPRTFRHLGCPGRKGKPCPNELLFLFSPLPAGSSPRARFGPAQSFPPTGDPWRRSPSWGLQADL